MTAPPGEALLTRPLLTAAILDPRAVAEGEPVALPPCVAAAVSVCTTFAPGARGVVTVTLFAEGDTQPHQTVVLVAPEGDEPAQTTAPLAVLATASVRAVARSEASGPVRDLAVTLTVR